MTIAMLGRLEKVELRQCWQHEAGDFTPWLAQADNIAILGEAIGLELEVQAQEASVGPFRADILCKDTATGSLILIENQLERTDHIHLGQLLTYAAGLSAVTVVWVAARFTDEHRAALDWLNEITHEGIHFFGLEVELWKIGESLPAPKFNVVSQPNDWARSLSGSAREIVAKPQSETGQLQKAFWTAFRDYVLSGKTTIRPTKPLPQNWMNLALGRSAIWMQAIASTYNTVEQSRGVGEIRAEVVCGDRDSEAYFALLEQDKMAIEAEFGEPLQWYSVPGVMMRRISLRRDADIRDETQWPELNAWLKDKLERLRVVFYDRVRRLDPADWAGSATTQRAPAATPSDPPGGTVDDAG